jgi:hypothetical protein
LNRASKMLLSTSTYVETRLDQKALTVTEMEGSVQQDSRLGSDKEGRADVNVKLLVSDYPGCNTASHMETATSHCESFSSPLLGNH